ncbi:flotillin-like FloA family protein [Mariniblastus sp.]|nr:flotillin-like FloA family protein [Mariniblastus sp.]
MLLQETIFFDLGGTLLSQQRLLGQFEPNNWLVPAIILIAIGTLLAIVMVSFKYGRLWLQAKSSNSDVSLSSLVGMSLRKVKPETIVTAQVMASQAGLTIASGRGMTTAALEAHYLAGGDVNRVILAIISANRAGIDLDFDRAAAIDLSGRDLEEAVRTSIFPKVIDCPDPGSSGSPSLSAIAKNGIELLVRVRVTVRTNVDQLIGGATEKTIIARVGQGIVSTIGSMDSHEEALATPNLISQAVLGQGIESNTAYEIVSIDVATIDVGRNIGARLQTEQAEADTRVARASAEIRRAEAMALLAEMTATVTAKKAELIRAESSVLSALAQAIRDGQFQSNNPDSIRPKTVLKFPGSMESA